MRPRTLTALLLAASFSVGCAAEPPAAVRAGEIAFTENEVLGLSGDRRERLALLAALGQIVAAGRGTELGAPLTERRRREALARLLDARSTLEEAGVGEAVLRARYRTDPAWELTVRHLIVLSERYETEATRAEARAKAERALERIRAGEGFPEVAAEVSEEPGAEGRQGLLSPGREGAWVPEFWRAANALEPGGISGVVETQYGFHVLRLEARDTVPFEEARTAVMTRVAAMVDPSFDRDTARSLPADLRWADDAAARATDAAVPDSATLATWADNRYTAGDYRRALAALERDAWERAVQGPEAARRQALGDAVALQAAASRAADVGLEVPEPAEAEIRTAWEDTLRRWSATLGLSPGMSADAVKEAARGALAAGGQNASLARDEVAARAPLLRFAVPIEVAMEGA
ncbi:MAG: peptidyl-prolyl cis-trans isomerase [Gemmatimonadetes bacterium]|nr:peptidyl-prolyl cis-trans isomerase [Gemmatimonadota bacterium]